MKKVGILLIVWMLASTNAWAFRGRCGTDPGSWLSSYMASELNLTEDQKIRIESVREIFLENIDPLRDALIAKGEELRQLWTDADPNQSAILAKQQEINEIRGQLEEKTIQYQFDCRQILTSEQRNRLATLTDHSCNRSVVHYGMTNNR